METDLITIREEELKAKLARLHDAIAGVEKELAELDVARNVLLRLAGKKPSTGSPNKGSKRARVAKPQQKKPEDLPTIKHLVLEALMDARQRGVSGLSPKQIRSYVANKYNYEMGSSANTVPSRMWRDEKILEKNTETGLFSIPSKEKPVDDNSLAGTSTGLFPNPERGREAGPGGGT